MEAESQLQTLKQLPLGLPWASTPPRTEQTAEPSQAADAGNRGQELQAGGFFVKKAGSLTSLMASHGPHSPGRPFRLCNTSLRSLGCLAHGATSTALTTSLGRPGGECNSGHCHGTAMLVPAVAVVVGVGPHVDLGRESARTGSGGDTVWIWRGLVAPVHRKL